MADIDKSLVEKYAPKVFAMTSLADFVSGMQMTRQRHASLQMTLEAMEKNYERYRRKLTPNNQLKRMHQPMRRKGS